VKNSGGSREGPGVPRSPLVWGKKEEMTKGRKAGRANKTKPATLLKSSLDLPLKKTKRLICRLKSSILMNY